MKQTLTFFSMMIVCIMVPGMINAETIRLKTGREFEGEVVERANSYFKLKTAEGVVKINLKDIDTGEPGPPKRNFAEGVAIEVFLVDWCPYCKSLEEFLQANNIEYKRTNIEKNLKDKIRMKKFGSDGGVPFTVVGSYTVSGYDPSRIIDLIKLQK